MALLPLALLSAAWTVSLAGAGQTTALADDTSTTNPTLPDGTSVPTQAIRAPASVSVRGGVAPAIHGDTEKAISTASASGIPAAALAAYQRAETVINAADKTCNLPWQLVAAIGRVESDHGRTEGNTLDGKGVARPGIFGPALNGSRGTSRIADTDAGQYDADAKWDRAVGPMQFIPSTWSVVGVDADGDGKRNPQDIDDAALATAVYLCSGDDDLSTTAGQRHAVYRYNHSRSYVDLVLSIMQSYLRGDFTSVPDTTTSAGYLVPEPKPAHLHQTRGSHHAAHHHGSSGPAATSGGQQPTQSQPSTPPSSAPEPSAPASPSSGGQGGGLLGGLLGGGHHSGGGSGSGGGGGLLPSTGVSPVDQLLSHAQAVVQCTAEGYVDNILRSDDPFDKCVYNYTH